MNRFKRGQPGRQRKMQSSARRRHQVENRVLKHEEAAQGPAAEPADVAAMVEAAEAESQESVKAAAAPICPLCNNPIWPQDQAKIMIKNRQKVLVHLDC